MVFCTVFVVLIIVYEFQIKSFIKNVVENSRLIYYFSTHVQMLINEVSAESALRSAAGSAQVILLVELSIAWSTVCRDAY